MSLLLPTRRKLISGVAAFAAMRDLSPDPAEALIPRGGAASPPVVIPVPPAASAVGFNRLSFNEDFNSGAGVDVNDTRAPGYSFYVHNDFPNNAIDPGGPTHPPTPASCFSFSGSIMTCSGGTDTNGNNGFLMCTSAANPSNPATLIGQQFGGGWYMEISMAYVVPSNGGADGWPVFWVWSTNILIDGLSPPTYATEIDMIEVPNTGGGSPQHNYIFRWENIGPSPTTLRNANGDVSQSYTPGNQNKFAYRWTPTSMNVGGAGIGTLQAYTNDVLVSASACTYSATAPMSPDPPGMSGGPNINGMYSDMDSEQFVVIIGFGKDNPSIMVDWVRVWQL